jgi:microcystin-dependent protein
MATPYLAELRIFSFNFAPKGWAMCNGQTLAINQNQALFALLGTTYGGNGITTFNLPNLQGRMPVHVGGGISLGQVGGEATHTLTVSEMTAHTHPVNGSSTLANVGDPTGNLWATGNAAYNPGPPNTTLLPASITNAGGSQPHENMSPYLVLTVCIALQGIFPPQN